MTRLGPSALSALHDGKQRPQVKGASIAPNKVFERLLGRKVVGPVRTAIYDLQTAGFAMTGLFLLEWLSDICEKDYYEDMMMYFSIDHSERAEWLNQVVKPRTERLKIAATVLKCESISAGHQGSLRKVEALANYLRNKTPADPYFPPFDDNDSEQYERTLELAKEYLYWLVKDVSVKAKAVTILQNAQNIIVNLRLVHSDSRKAISAECKSGFELALSDFQSCMGGFLKVLEDADKYIKSIIKTDRATRSQHGGGNDDLYDGIVNLGTEMRQSLSMAIANTNTALDDFRRVMRAPGFTPLDWPVYRSVVMSRFKRRTTLLWAAAIREIYKMPNRILSLVKEIVDLFGAVARASSQRHYNFGTSLIQEIDKAKKRGLMSDFPLGQRRVAGPGAAYKDLFGKS